MNFPLCQLKGETISGFMNHLHWNFELPVVGKNTLRTSKLGSDLHADFDRKEITFLPTTQNLNPSFTVHAWKMTTNLVTGIQCRSSIAL
jgi:hypothetical protein